MAPMARFHPARRSPTSGARRAMPSSSRWSRREGAAAAFDFTQGQYLTFRRDFDGEELRRSYSICAGKDDGWLQVGIKRVDGGAFSSWANEELKAGDTLDAMPPDGQVLHPAPSPIGAHYLGVRRPARASHRFCRSSRPTLAREPRRGLHAGLREPAINSIMFREELEDLKNIHIGRLSIIHILESEGQEIDLFTGRIDADKMENLFRLWIDPESVDVAYICGPEPMMLTIADSLRRHGFDDSQIRFELFASSQPGRAKRRATTRQEARTGNVCDVTVTLDGATRRFQMPKDGTALLDAAIENRMDAPFSCKAGVCSTCRAKVLEGEVEMEINHALEDYEVKAGYVLSCQCVPLSDKVVLTYDE